MKEIEQVINRYLEENETDYAIMITGEWGCGKTFFVNHALKKLIEEKKCLIADKEVNYKLLYLSLYGISDPSEINIKILEQLFPILKHKYVLLLRHGLSGFLDLKGIDKQTQKEFSNYTGIKKNTVLVFDDLERLNDNKVDVKEILGIINQFAEHDNLKVIVICHDEKVDDDFSEFKEKSIRYSMHFWRPLSESFDDIVLKNKNDDYLAFLKEQKELIICVFQLGECNNLRTLKFIIDAFRVLFDKVKNVKYASEILKDLLISMLVYSIEYKNGEKTDNLKKLSELKSYMGWVHDEGDEPKEPEYIDRLWKKYNEINDEYHFYPVINEFVANGYLNGREIDSLIIELGKKYKKLEDTPEGKLFKKICNWSQIKDEELHGIIDKIIIAVKDCKYSVGELTELYYLLLKIEYYGIEDFRLNKKIENTFKESAKTVMQRTGFDFYIETEFFYYTPNQYGKELDNRYECYLNFLGEINQELRKKSDQNTLDGFMEELHTNNANKIVEYCKGPSCQFLFENLDSKAVSEALLVANVETVEAFRKGVYYRYPDGIVDGQLSHNEIQFLLGLHDEITSFIDNQHPRKLSSVWYQLLSKKLAKILVQYGAVKKEIDGENK